MSVGELPAVGIGLGMSLSVVAFLDADGRPTMVINAMGDLTTSSVVLIDDDSVVVGEEAFKAARFEPDRVSQFDKRDMGSPSYPEPINGEHRPPEVNQPLARETLGRNAVVKWGGFLPREAPEGEYRVDRRTNTRRRPPEKHLAPVVVATADASASRHLLVRQRRCRQGRPHPRSHLQGPGQPPLHRTPGRNRPHQGRSPGPTPTTPPRPPKRTENAHRFLTLARACTDYHSDSDDDEDCDFELTEVDQDNEGDPSSGQ
ncbi:MAG: Hsp70 family protein [Singulisphaera sp.]